MDSNVPIRMLSRMKSNFFRRFVAATCALSLTFLSVAEAAAPSEDEKIRARALMTLGRSKRKGGDHRGALDAFRRAHELMKVPTTGYEFALSQIDVGLLVEALETLLAIASSEVEKNEPKPFAEAREKATRKAEQLAPKVPSVRLLINKLPAGLNAKVTLDGKELAESIWMNAIKANPGLHELKVSAGTYEKERKFSLNEGESSEFGFDLSDAKPIAMIADSGTGQPADAPSKDAFIEDAIATDVHPNGPLSTFQQTSTSLEGDKREQSRGIHGVMIAGIVLTGASLLSGGITGILSLTQASKIKERCDGNRCPEDSADDLRKARTMATFSTISFAVAGAGLVTTLVGYLLGDSKSPSRDISSVRPWIGVGSVGVIGRF